MHRRLAKNVLNWQHILFLSNNFDATRKEKRCI